MVFSYSPQHEGGTLHLPSPTHCHHFDATSTLIQLRRSLSRSPSKSPAFRLVTTKPNSPNTRSALSPSPLSPHRHVSRLHVPGGATTTHDARANSPSSPLGLDMPASQRTTRASVRKYSPLRAATATRAHLLRTPNSRRILGESLDGGNASRNSALDPSTGAENAPSTTPPQGSIVQPPKVEFNGFGTGVSESADLNASSNDYSFSPVAHNFNFLSDKHPSHLSGAPVKSSPLKRVDAPSKTDPSEGSSPSAKRRSLHGASDFDIFDQFATMQGLQTTASGRMSPPRVPSMNMDGAQAPSPVSKRATSLRKSTLQQRHQERPIMSRTKASSNLGTDFMPAATVARVLDGPRGHLPTRRNLFTFENPSTAGEDARPNETAMEPPPAPARHPLSRTVTQSSSGSEMTQDSPTHAPVRAPEIRRQQGAFARSLPIGLGRNQTLARQTSGGLTDGGDVSTPDNFKTAKPSQAAFMSTGLISKRTKFLQDSVQGEVKNMPDTPCKRPMPINPMAPGSTPAPAPRHTQLRRSQHSFGSPSTPFNAGSSRPSAGAMGKGASVFGSSIKPLNRRGSFLSVDNDETASGEHSTRQSLEGPPTPSKASDFVVPRQGSDSFIDFEARFSSRDDGVDDESATPEPRNPDGGCKLILSSPDGLNFDADGDSMMQESPSAHRRFSSLGGLTSYPAHRRPSILPDEHSPSPTPQSRKSHTLPHIRTSNLNLNGTPSFGAPTSPLFGRHEHKGPHTPRDSHGSVAPPDPSGLSISGQAQQSVDFRKSVSLGNTIMPPPATPTANRDSSRFQSNRAAATSTSAIAETQVDPSLTARFDHVEMIGEGEFSSVLRVSCDSTATPASSGNPFDSFSTTSTAKSSGRRVWAVKKSRHPFKSRADRTNKLKEVEVLRALGFSEHTIALEDHWEYDSHLYIQTEFCDEGSLDKFLNEAGRAARVDDFRIWKILLEVGLGLKFIHDSGFIHLDLKPANILITFDGTLKIADFGMATSWPAQKGIEGEGDREYIGPEILQGKYDKPADIYALGLILLEIAANVVLPDNGLSWRRLRSGDMSDVPSLTSNSNVSVYRDASGRVIEDDGNLNPAQHNMETPVPALETPPAFMASKDDPHSLDSMVSWMINPTPDERPAVDEVLQSVGVQWVASRRRAGASIYEGNWGPADEVLAQDAEMIDV